ncbi:MAG: beta-ketoacyl synthase N-terminal-like domain-containing protein, partial [Myxococcota bacterium]
MTAPALFSPIAVVGRACLLPGASSPGALWDAVHQGRDLISRAPAGRWGLAAEDILCADPRRSADRAWSDRGGYVRDFHLDADGFQIPRADIAPLDPIFQWSLHTARQALDDMTSPAALGRTGAIFGNLSFPSAGLSHFAEATWLEQAWGADALRRLGITKPDPRNRFMSGLPALLLKQALGLGGESFCLDAACASALYAIKLACDRLHDGRADVMLAGAVNSCDDLFIHVGFCALNAMSQTGRSRPFHAEADGLVPAEGAGFIVLKRLDDALHDGDRIHGVIRGIGLSNDGRGRGLLAPAEEGQRRALRAAYDVAGIDPRDVTLLECHATGTPVGDATEIRSAAAVFAGHAGLPLGSLKSNLGHLITAAGVAGLIKVMEAMRAGVRPPTLHAAEHPNAALQGTPFRLLHQPEPWTGRRLAGISAFGFGGNNAHLIIESPEVAPRLAAHPAPRRAAEIAIVAVGVQAGSCEDRVAFEDALFNGGPLRRDAAQVTLDLKGLRFPPNDLKRALGQQLLMLRAGDEAISTMASALPRNRTGIFIGMGADAEVARYGARWRTATWARSLGADETWRDAAREGFVPVLKSAGVLGTMPNIPANRLNSQFDLAGPSCTISAEELSGLVALDVACNALQDHELDAAMVGAVDMSCEPVHQAAAATLLSSRPAAGDAAVAVILKRREDAERDDDVIFGLLRTDGTRASAPPISVSDRFGHAHAASGLLDLAAAALCVYHRRRPGGAPLHADALMVDAHAMTGDASRWIVGRTATSKTLSPPPTPQHPLRFLAHPASIDLPPLPEESPVENEPNPILDVEAVANPNLDAGQTWTMAPAPRLPSVLSDPPPAMTPSPQPQPQAAVVPPQAPMAPTPPRAAVPGMSAIYQRYQAQVERVAQLHRGFLDQQSATHDRFLKMRQNMMMTLFQAAQGRTVTPTMPTAPPHPTVTNGVHAPPRPQPPLTPRPQLQSQPVLHARATPKPAPRPSPLPVTKQPVKPAAQKPSVNTPSGGGHVVAAHAPPPVGMTLNRAQLKVHASGNISEIFGPVFTPQDSVALQVRMPEPPLLLADRMTGLDAEPGSMKKGTIWTETDVTWDSWYLNRGRMPAGIMIESGQADLMLISYLGIDLLNQGERAYRLLGCELMYHRALPKPGETLCYDIHVDGHAAQGPVRLFFFHYDCRINGEPALTVRQGQAGFFTTQELDDSAGILWKPETQEIRQDARMDAPEQLTTRRAFTAAQVAAFAEGRPWACFGDDFYLAKTHTLTPRIQSGDMLFMRDVTVFDPKGGPWGRGYLKVEVDLSPEDWYFDGHFKNDPCMPGTLMFEGCLQAMAFYLAALGFTLTRDGWRFEPVTGIPYPLRCRGQVTPASKTLVYELFIEEVIGGPEPTLFADLLCTVDGLGAFHARGMGLKMVPDWPMTAMPKLLAGHREPKPVATDAEGFPFDYASLMACAWGRPSKAFGSMYSVFDGTRKVARLPGPPYHFMSRVTRIEGALNRFKTGVVIELEYDIPPESWYFTENGAPTMPFAVLLEAALQPCGWLASAVGSALTVDRDLMFRNLDGTGTILQEIPPDAGTLRTVVEITGISRSAGMIIESFDVDCYIGDERVYDLKTVFGFFPPEAFENQAGLPTTAAQRAILTQDSGFQVDLTARPERYCGGAPRLARPMLLMIDRVTGYWPDAGEANLGTLRAEKDVDPDEWFFKAHFYQDPVQPGSLGLEALLQLLQFYMLERDMAEGIDHPRFESIAVDREMTWKYRGQVVPHNKVISSTLEVTEIGRDDRGAYAIAEGSLWVDGKRIYETHKMGMRIVPGDATDRVTYDPEAEAWLSDHRPTFQRAALPMMSMVDLLAGAASGTVIGLRNVRVRKWVDFDGPRTLRREISAKGEARLFASTPDGGEELVALGDVVTGTYLTPPPPLPPVAGAVVSPSPYETGELFHGPTLQLMQQLVMGAQGSSARLNLDLSGAPTGRLNPGLLDAATHGIPHSQPDRWSHEIRENSVLYPTLITKMDIFG